MRPSLSVMVAFGLVIAGCSGGGGDQADAGDGGGNGDAAPDVIQQADAAPDAGSDAAPDSGGYPAFQVLAPQVVNAGGAILAAPKVVPIYFNNDDTNFTGNLTTALNKVPGSSYWSAIATEYGVGAITVETPIQLTVDAPTTIDDSAIQTWIAGQIGTNLPAPDANTLYTIFYPSTTTITQNADASCAVFEGYHGDFMYQGTTDVAYGVVARCTGTGGRTDFEETFGTTTHELIEAATDPYNPPAYSTVDDAHAIWASVLGGGEVGDMCADSAQAFFTPAEIGTVVQRTWSNAAASAGHDPCVPAEAVPYFNAMPVLTDDISFNSVTAKGVTIPAGQTKTIEVDLYSDAPTSGPWTVDAVDAATLHNQAAQLTFTWDATTGQNGDKLHLSITASTLTNGTDGFVITSTLNGRKNTWVGLVGN